MALMLIVVAAWIASGVGQVALRRLNVLRDRPLERWVYACAIGLGIAAYGVFGLGLLGMLSRPPVALWWVILAVCGLPGMRIQAIDAAAWIRAARQPRTQSNTVGDQNSWRLLQSLCVIGLLVMAAICVVACFRPPDATEWDALAYHLADPKLYILQHAIRPLPTEHHSNFPFTVEMLFAVGLLFNGFALANLFHFLFGVLTVLALIACGARLFDARTGFIAALIYATTPLVIWEASVAYIDVAAALYTSLALLAVLSALHRRVPSVNDAPDVSGWTPWLMLAGAMMGFALGIKYLALIPCGLAIGLLVVRRVPIRSVIVFVGVASVIGSPWYVKNLIWMRNPVYPFYYRLFPQTRYWSLDREIPYNSEQNGFGYPHSLKQPRDALLNLLQSPWRMVVDANRYYNAGEVNFCIWIGGLYGGLIFALALRGRLPRAARDLLGLTGIQIVAWFFLAQVGRYLLQALPLAALLAGYSATTLLAGGRDRRGLASNILRIAVPALIGGHFVYVVWSLLALPTGGEAAAELRVRTGLLQTAVSIPDSISDAENTDQASEGLRRHLDTYPADQWINRNTPRDARVVLYEDTRGYYLDRAYLWGNGGHSSYIPYGILGDGKSLTDWLHARGYRYAIINLNWSPGNVNHEHIAPEVAATRLQEWYVNGGYPAGSWRFVIGDAMRRGLWQIVDVESGNVVLQLGPTDIPETTMPGTGGSR